MLSPSASSTNLSRIALSIRTALGRFPDTEALPDAATNDGSDLSQLTRAAIRVLAQQSAVSEREALAQAIVGDRRYLRCLIDPDLLPIEDCFQAAKILAKADTGFTAGLVRATDDVAGDRSVMRAVELIERLGQSGVTAQWIRRLTVHQDGNIRSKAVKILSTLYGNPSLIEKQLGSPDARVRANALEGLWGENSPRHRQLLDRAASDPHHRVAANGLYGLYLANAPGTVERMIDAASAPSPQHRAAVAWAMGRTQSPVFRTELQKLAADPEECVRSSAKRALAELLEDDSLVQTNP